MRDQRAHPWTFKVSYGLNRRAKVLWERAIPESKRTLPSQVAFAPGGADAYVVGRTPPDRGYRLIVMRYSLESGRRVWQVTLDDVDGLRCCYGARIEVSANGRTVALGGTCSSTTPADYTCWIYVGRVNAKGEVTMEKLLKLSGGPFKNQSLEDLAVTADKGMALLVDSWEYVFLGVGVRFWYKYFVAYVGADGV